MYMLDHRTELLSHENVDNISIIIATCRYFRSLLCQGAIVKIKISFTVVSRVSAHGHLNITHYFGPHGCLPRI